SRSAVSANGGSYLFKGADVTDTSLSVTPSESFSQEYTISLEGLEFATTDASTLQGYITVTDSADTVGDDLGTISVAVSSVTTSSCVVTISGTPATNTYEEGELTFTLASGAITDVTDSLSCVTKPSYVINGGTASITASSLSVTGYGTVDATCTSDTITLTLGHATFSSTSVSSDVLTVTDDPNGLTPTISDWTIAEDLASATFKVSVSKDLESSADDITGTLSFSLDAAGTNLGSGTLPISTTISYALGYKSYLTYPSASDVVTATGSDTSASVYTTVINLAAFDESVSLATSLSAGDTVATGTIGSTDVTAVAVSAVSAGATLVPVKISYTTAPTGEVSLTTASGVVASPITITQTDTAHIATSLAFVQDFESDDIDVTSIGNIRNLSTSTVTIETADNNSYLQVAPGNVNDRAYNFNATKAAGTYVVAFKAALTAGTDSAKSSQVAIANSFPGGGSANTAASSYLFALSAAGGSTNWYINGSSSDYVTLTAGEFYNFVISIDSSSEDSPVTVSITDEDGNTVLEETSVTPTATAYNIVGLHMLCGRYNAVQCLDDFVIYE
nr:hypothetical protein [Treponema sp.]